ncbi:MAG: hypothetical protein ACI9AU_000793 [Bacteroidia bacterium]|jgi:hypothetical protein
MMPKITSKKYLKTGRITALFSFLIGTVIFALYYFTSAFMLLFIGYAFVVFVGILNLILLFVILARANSDSENRAKLLKTSGLLLLNIPVMLFYCWVAIVLLGTMRITFTNNTENQITDINVVGCGDGYINQLEVGESTTVWVKIIGDCDISIDYLYNGKREREEVIGYVTSSMGQKWTYKISRKNIKLVPLANL